MKKIKYLLILFLSIPILLIKPENFVKANFLSWEVVMNNGFGEGNQNRSINTLLVFGDYLYAAVYNEADGAKIFRSSNGENWTQVNENGFGNPNHTSVILFTDGNNLYAGTSGEFGVSGFKLLKSTNGTDWIQIGSDGFGTADNYAINSMTVFGGKLYISVFYIDFATFATGLRIYRIDSDSSWTKVNQEGFGDSNNISSYAMSVFDNQLYVGTQHTSQGPEVWRSNNGTDWLRVVDNGFGETNGRFFTSIFSFHHKIYASMMSTTGFELWRSDDGSQGSWVQVGEDGFGNINNAWTGYTPVIVNDKIYLGAGNEVLDLAKIFISENGEDWIEEDNSSFVDAGDEGVWTGTFFKNRIYFAIGNEDLGARIIRSQELPGIFFETSSNSLPVAKLGKSYNYQLEISNGTPPFYCTWSGDLPEGMTVTSECKIQGTPQHASNYIFTVYLTDSGIPPQNYSQQFVLSVNEENSSEEFSLSKNISPTPKITELPETGSFNNEKKIFKSILLWTIALLVTGIIFLFSRKTRGQKEN